MVIAMVMMSCNEIKLDDITVTSQLNSPNMPIMEITENAQQIMGNKIQRIFLKIIPNIMMSKNNTPTPKTLRSFLIKLIKSSAIMLTPPRKRSASSRYLSIMSRIEAMSWCRAFFIRSRWFLNSSTTLLNLRDSSEVRDPVSFFCLRRSRVFRRSR